MIHQSFESEPERDPALLEADERRAVPRFAARAVAIIYRDSDAMRRGIQVELHDISIAGLGLTVDEIQLDLLETVKIRLRNELQRFDREVRGVVRHISPLSGGQYRVGVELTTRLTPLEVSLLKIRPLTGQSDGNSTWV